VGIVGGFFARTGTRPGTDRLFVVKALLLGQLGGVLLVAGIASVFGLVSGYSALLGGLICLIPNVYFAFRAFKYRGARAARHIVRSFYLGEAVKLGLTAGLFTLVFVGVKPLAPLALFIGYLSVQLVGWLVPLCVDRAKVRAGM